MKKKIKKKYLKWLRVVFLLYRSSFEILIHFKPMTWQHLKETAIDSCFCGTNMKQTSLFTLGEIKSFISYFFCNPRAFNPLIGSGEDQKSLACKDDSNHKHTFIPLTLYFFNIIVEKSIAIRITLEFLSL